LGYSERGIERFYNIPDAGERKMAFITAMASGKTNIASWCVKECFQNRGMVRGTVCITSRSDMGSGGKTDQVSIQRSAGDFTQAAKRRIRKLP